MTKMCGYCVYMDLSKEEKGKYRCERDGCWRFASSADATNCYKYCERFRRDMDKAEAAIKNSKRYQEASKEYTAVGCYITTVVVNILGMEDDCDLLMTLRKFRKEVLHPNPLYKDILLKYDALGPALAKAIAASKNCLSLAEDLYNIYLKGCAKYIKAGQTEKAIALYSKMTNCLISTFIDIQAIGEEVIENYDQENGGRGAIRLKK